LSPPEFFTDARLGDDLLWRELRVEGFSPPRPALFLDRDGVIIEEKEYIRNAGDVELLPGIGELIRAARSQGLAIIEVTNQAGIARGYFGWPEFLEVESRMRQLLAEQGAGIDAFFACPFHPQGTAPYQVANHPWRKPNPGMLLEAAKLVPVILRESVLVGDKASDQQAARAAGLACGIHLLTGHGRAECELACATATQTFPVHVAGNARNVIPFLNPAPVFDTWPVANSCEAGNLRKAK
jgi:D-glycero-D-manno-heptose 1,7-bisphosphate phosphatase